MSESYRELARVLARVRSRWRTVAACNAVAVVAAATVVVIGVAFAIDRLVVTGLAHLGIWGSVVVLVIAACAAAVFYTWRAPDDCQVARYVEERCPELDDAVATAVAQREHDGAPAFADVVIDDALRRLRTLDLDRVVNRATMRRSALRAIAAAGVLAVTLVIAGGPIFRAGRLFSAYTFPDRITLTVTPGDVRVRAGDPLEIVLASSTVLDVNPVLHLTSVGGGDLPAEAGSRAETLSAEAGSHVDNRSTELRSRVNGEGGSGVSAEPARHVEQSMHPSGERFSYRVEHVEEPFTYKVAAAGASTREYRVSVVRPPHVERIDLRYEYPSAFDMESRVEEDGGDIYGPAGTRVHVSVHTDKPIASGQLKVTGGTTVTLAPGGNVLEGELTIGGDGSYRVALTDADGLNNPGETEYFIRTLEDRPPEVRIVRPAADRDVTPIEEVSIEARADDDFGIAQFDLVYAVRGGEEKALPLQRSGAGMTINGRATLYLEDLGVAPGDFVTYYARARDISRGKRSTEARSDIFFLQVSPFEEEFVLAQSQGGGQSGDSSVDDLVEAQKDLITATWKVDRRARDAGAASSDDVRTLAKGQSDLRRRALAAAAQMQRNADVRRRRPGVRAPAGLPPAEPSEDAMTKAAEAMLGAQQQLEALKTSPALPFEMKALNELMRAQADVRRREVQRQQSGGGSGRAANRQQQDLSSLFDRELARQQQSNYEAGRATSETRNPNRQDDTLDRIRELARRQEALNREQGTLPAQSEEERKRTLERLTREQSELRQQAEELSRRLQQGTQQAAGRQQGRTGEQGSSSQGNDRSRAMNGVSEQMRAAAGDLRRQDAGQARQRGERALEQLKRLEEQMRGATGDSLARALSELQNESRQLGQAQRQLSATGQSGRGRGADAADQRAAEQNRLADRMRNLEDTVRGLARNGAQGARQEERSGLADTSRELDRQRLSQRMREAAGNRDEAAAAREGSAIAGQLDKLAERLGAAGTGDSSEARRLGEQLSRLRELRDRLSEVEQQLARQAGEPRPGRDGQGQPSSSARAQQGRQGNNQNQGNEQGGEQNAMDAARQLVDQMRREGALGLTPGDIARFSPGQSAPGTEAWKQDFGRWDELRQQMAAALEKAETTAAARLREQRARDRLNAGAAQSVPDEYRRLVESYYRALASRAPSARAAQGK